MDNEQMKHFGYFRKSSESDERQIQSIPDQANALKPLAQSKNLQVLEWLEESASAKKPGRKIFTQMINRIKKGEAEGIIIWDPSRASRNATDTGALIQLMDDGYLKEIVTPYQTFRNNPNDKFLFSLLCSMAKKDNDDKSVNVKRAIQSRAERGLPIGAPRPGYRSIPGRKQGEKGHEPDPIYYPLMKKLFKLYLTGNWSVMALCKEAQRLGIRNSRGKLLTKSCLFRNLQDPYYKGIIEHIGNQYPAEHTPMLTNSEFEIIQDILKGKSRPKFSKREYPLAGALIRCGECGYSIIGDTHFRQYKSGKSQVFTHYRCSKKGQTKCNQLYVQADELERQAEEFLATLDIPQDFIDLAVECIRDQDKSRAEEKEAETKTLQHKHTSAQSKLNNLTELYLSGSNTDKSVMSEDEYIELKARLTRERDEALEALKSVDERRDDDMELAFKMFNFTVGIRDRFRNGTLEEKKRVMQVVGSNLILLDKNLDIQARKPFIIIKYMFEASKPQNTGFVPKVRHDNLSPEPSTNFWHPQRNEVRTYLSSLTPLDKQILTQLL